MSTLPRHALLRRELPAASRVPYTAHLSDTVVRTCYGAYVQVFRLAGASFESADDDQLNAWHERLNVTWRNLGTPQLALWSHLIRRRETLPEYLSDTTGFAHTLEAKYRHRLTAETLMVNDLYLTTVYRPVTGVATSAISKLLSRTQHDADALERRDALDACQKLSAALCASLARYEPEPLGLYVQEGRTFSHLLEFFASLINGDSRPIPLAPAPLSELLATSRLFFGLEAIEYRLPTQTRAGAVLAIKEYPTPTTVGLFNRLLTAAFPFVLTQSFTFLSKAAGQALLQRQYNRMLNAGDFAISQAEQLHEALDALTSNEFVMGDHHLSLQVLTDPDEDPTAQGTQRRLKRLNDHVALARAILADTGMNVAREDLALEAAFWAQLPGHFPMRPRKAPITSRNFAAMVPFHNYPTGRPAGNHWGDALTVLISSARSPYYFSLHASDPNEPDGGSRKDTGHTFICGPTGSGKSVFIGFLAATFARRGVTQVIFDKDHGLEILVRALDGEYLPLKNDQPTGFNPLQLPSTTSNIEFLKSWLRLLVRTHQPLTTSDQTDLDQALRGTLTLDPEVRRLSRLIEFTDPTRSDGLYARLAPWCHSTRGEYAPLFDNPDDSVVPRLNDQSLLGFDVTDFLNNDAVRAPLTAYLFHLVRLLLDGRQLVCWCDEFWRLLADPAFERFAQDGPKTWRKLNAVMAFATQSPGDVLQSPISRTLIEQTPTKVFFPNPDAREEDYIDGFALTQREFLLLKQEIEPGSRKFLIKQGHTSLVCQLDLKGFDGELKVISGRASEVTRVRRFLEECGPDPQRWLPLFMGDRT